MLVPFKVGDEHRLLIEVSEPVSGPRDQGGPVVRGGRGRDSAQRVTAAAAASLRDAVEQVLPAAQVVLGAVDRTITGPDQITVAFGIGLTAGADAFIASASASANFSVTLTWDRPRANSASADPGHA